LPGSRGAAKAMAGTAGSSRSGLRVMTESSAGGAAETSPERAICRR
jgi:hypothetical protein